MFVFMRSHVPFILTRFCSSIHTNACSNMRMHAKTLHTHAQACVRMVALRNHNFHYFDSFSPISLSNGNSHVLLSYFFLQVLPPFLGRGCTSRISSWYRALTYDTKAFVCAVGFEPILRLLPESHYSAILIQSLAERWWDTIHTFHIPEMKMTVTPHDFHRITSLRCDGLLINLEGESGILLGIDLLGEGT